MTRTNRLQLLMIHANNLTVNRHALKRQWAEMTLVRAAAERNTRTATARINNGRFAQTKSGCQERSCIKQLSYL